MEVYIKMDSMNSEYQPFDTLQKIVRNYHIDGVEMLILHPGYLDAYILKTSSLTVARTLEVDMATSLETLMWLNSKNVELITYDSL